MHVWKNERGLTLTELMAAVVIMSILVVPMTSLGTAYLHSYRADQLVHGAVLLAEEVMTSYKVRIEQGEELEDEERRGRRDPFTWSITTSGYELDGEEVPGLIAVAVTVSYPDPLNPDQTGQYTLSAVARMRVTP